MRWSDDGLPVCVPAALGLGLCSLIGLVAAGERQLSSAAAESGVESQSQRVRPMRGRACWAALPFRPSAWPL